jgi:pimeloyl-ACP methyl ester carboxylesterase
MTDAEYVAMEKSTNVRSRSRGPRLPFTRSANRAFSALAPALAARVATRRFLTPPRPRRPLAEIDLIATACARPLRAGGRRLETWTWGVGPRVLLVHGWGGRGTQLGSFIGPLVAHGFSVVTFDAPGHGASDSGMVTIPEIATAIHEVVASRGRFVGLIAHSAGALAATRALYEGLDVAAAVYIAPAVDLVGPAVRFTETLGFSRAVRERMERNIEARVGRPLSTFEVAALAPMLDTPLLVIHDRGDAEVPWQHGMMIVRAWRGAQMLMTDGLGHHRILSARDMVASTVAFIAARTADRRQKPLVDAELVDPLPTRA